MKFVFPLDRVLAFRRLQADIERAALEKLAGERQKIVAQIAEVERQAELTVRDAATRSGLTIVVEELTAREGYLEHLRRLGAEMSRVLAAKDAEVARQRQILMEAERRCRLIEKLRERKMEEWEADLERRYEEMAADAHRSRMHWAPAR
jgi:flagellar export protein FliJ